MNEEFSSNLFIGSFLTSILGGIILLVSDFAGWYNYDAYDMVRSWGWIGVSVDAPLSSLILITVAICLFYCTYISYLGLQSADKLTQQVVRRGLFLASTAFVIIVVAALIFTTEMLLDEPTDWWLDTGFYGGFLGSGLTALFFHLTSKSRV